MCAVFVYRGRSSPLCLYDTFPSKKGKTGLQNYVNGTYVLNPFYQAHLSGIPAGVYRISDLAPDNFIQSVRPETMRIIISNSEEIGFVTEDWPQGLEEVNIALPLGQSTTVEVNLLRSTQNGGFGGVDLKAVEQGLPVFCNSFSKFWSLRQKSVVSPPPNPRMDELFNAFGKPDLTKREQEVVKYVLKGHSSESISRNLNISITTVKTHRKRAYAKLNISTQSELLSKFLSLLEAAVGEVGRPADADP